MQISTLLEGRPSRGDLVVRQSGQLPDVDRVANRGVLADAEDLAQVQRVDPVAMASASLAVDAQPLQGGGQAAQAGEAGGAHWTVLPGAFPR
jgi:hypothetical protein